MTYPEPRHQIRRSEPDTAMPGVTSHPMSPWCPTAWTFDNGHWDRVAITWCGSDASPRKKRRTWRSPPPDVLNYRWFWPAPSATSITSTVSSRHRWTTTSATPGTSDTMSWHAWSGLSRRARHTRLARAVWDGGRRSDVVRHARRGVRMWRNTRNSLAASGRSSHRGIRCYGAGDTCGIVDGPERGSPACRWNLFRRGDGDGLPQDLPRDDRQSEENTMIGYYIHHHGRGHLHRATA